MTTRADAYTLYSDSYSHTDGVEDVTYTPVHPSGAAVTDVKALRGDLSRQELFRGSVAGIEPTDLIFTLWDATLSGNTPTGGDVITDADNVSYTIRSASRAVWNTQWLCICYQQVT